MEKRTFCVVCYKENQDMSCKAVPRQRAGRGRGGYVVSWQAADLLRIVCFRFRPMHDATGIWQPERKQDVVSGAFAGWPRIMDSARSATVPLKNRMRRPAGT
ncbi:Uncharacterised protein [Rikenella microfusus]|uniref:Uncharacterized protein n=1 Tax=Rikenella microfusus TaxID=28139 RepID=A0A379MQ70_9BACT|nr:Uncharacterised protein [Rikenella microfusus]